MVTDSDREATQDDVDRLQRTAYAFAELAKKLQFYIAEVRNGLAKPGAVITDIENALREAKATAETLDISELTNHPVGACKVIVIER